MLQYLSVRDTWSEEEKTFLVENMTSVYLWYWERDEERAMSKYRQRRQKQLCAILEKLLNENDPRVFSGEVW